MPGNEYLFYYGFQSPGERTSFENGILKLAGQGTDLGCGIMVNKEAAQCLRVLFKLKGSIKKLEAWTRLRIEVYGSENDTRPAVSHEMVEQTEWPQFTQINIPLENRVSGMFKIQMMIIGPSEASLEFKDFQFH